MPTIYLDSCVFVLAFESVGALADPARRLMNALRSRPRTAVTSELTIAELLAPVKRPTAMPAAKRQRLYLELFDDGKFIELLPVSRSILLSSVNVREHFPQRLPDAIHVATALDIGCRHFVSYDRDARRLPSPLDWVVPDVEAAEDLLRALDG